MDEILKIVTEFVLAEGLIMIPALFLLGYMIKHTELINELYVPIIILVVSIVLTPALLGNYGAENIVQSILVAGIPTLIYEIYKNGKDIVE